VALVFGALSRCTEEVQVGENTVGVGTPDPQDASLPDEYESSLPSLVTGGASDGGSTVLDAGACAQIECGEVQECGNCSDDDGDGLADSADPDCLGPCDNDESELMSGLAVRVNSSCRTDCYFDGNSGDGDDGCSRDFHCERFSVPPSYLPTGNDKCDYRSGTECAPQPDQCLQKCLPFVPNGCDCFGCCELPAAGGTVWLGAENLDVGACQADPSRCPRCTPDPSCFNVCRECELCVGKTTLPATCPTGANGAPLPECPPGRPSCDPANGVGCGGLEFCTFGCCIPFPE
jgi:hypothetical protein